MICVKSQKEISLMRKAGIIASEVLELMKKNVVPGVTTAELDRLARECIVSHGATPSFLNYRGFPASVCASVNDVVIHGIPSKKQVVKEGDIVSIDVGVYKDGFHADCARTFGAGKISSEAQRLIDVTKQSFFEGIAHAKAGERLSNISNAVQTHVEENGFSVVRDFVGHGIGAQLHEDPSIPNFGAPGRGPRLYPGMTLAVEPMVNAGKREVYVADDGWTTYTKDHSLSAHYENTILITDNEPLILTIS